MNEGERKSELHATKHEIFLLAPLFYLLTSTHYYSK